MLLELSEVAAAVLILLALPAVILILSALSVVSPVEATDRLTTLILPRLAPASSVLFTKLDVIAAVVALLELLVLPYSLRYDFSVQAVVALLALVLLASSR